MEQHKFDINTFFAITHNNKFTATLRRPVLRKGEVYNKLFCWILLNTGISEPLLEHSYVVVTA